MELIAVIVMFLVLTVASTFNAHSYHIKRINRIAEWEQSEEKAFRRLHQTMNTGTRQEADEAFHEWNAVSTESPLHSTTVRPSMERYYL
jgi:hypothetical protein